MMVRMRRCLAKIVSIILLAYMLPTSAQDSVTTYKMLKMELALEVAQETLKACREEDYQIAVAIVDRSGIVQIMLRDQLAGPHTLDTARRKAWTAISFKGDTRSIAEATQSESHQSGARFVTDAIMVGGGLPLYAEGVLVGAIGVSGAPTAGGDERCAQKGADFLEDKLLF